MKKAEIDTVAQLMIQSQDRFVDAIRQEERQRTMGHLRLLWDHLSQRGDVPNEAMEAIRNSFEDILRGKAQ